MAKLKSSAKAKAGTQGKSAGAKAGGDRSAAGIEGVSRSIMDSAQQIWLAGMGAFSRAQAEGTRLFETLVKEGASIEQRTRKLATGQVDAVRGAVESRVGQVRERASDTWDRLEQVFEDRVQRALTRLGVPGREDIKALTERVDDLTREVRRLQGGPAVRKGSSTARKAAPRTKAARKAAKRPAPRKRAPAAPKAPKGPVTG